MKDGTQCVKGTTTKATGAPPSHKRRWGDTPSNSGSATPTGKVTPRSEPESAQAAPPESPAPQDAGNLDTTQGAAHARTKLNELAQQRQEPAQGEPSSLTPEHFEIRRHSEETMNDPDQKSRSDAIRANGPRDLVIYILRKYGYLSGKKNPLPVHSFIFLLHASKSKKYLDTYRPRTSCLQHLKEWRLRSTKS